MNLPLQPAVLVQATKNKRALSVSSVGLTLMEPHTGKNFVGSFLCAPLSELKLRGNTRGPAGECWLQVPVSAETQGERVPWTPQKIMAPSSCLNVPVYIFSDMS